MSKKIVTVGILALILCIGGTVYALRRLNQDQLPQAATTSSAKTAQSDYEEGGPRQSNVNSPTPEGGVVDTRGQIDATELPTSDKWTVSESGAITLQQPSTGSTVKSGDMLSGTASTDAVQYRLVDQKVGVIGQGSLQVVNGKFSGTLQFPSTAGSGTISIFSYDRESGREVNNLKIKVKFE